MLSNLPRPPHKTHENNDNNGIRSNNRSFPILHDGFELPFLNMSERYSHNKNQHQYEIEPRGWQLPNVLARDQVNARSTFQPIHQRLKHGGQTFAAYDAAPAPGSALYGSIMGYDDFGPPRKHILLGSNSVDERNRPEGAGLRDGQNILPNIILRRLKPPTTMPTYTNLSYGQNSITPVIINQEAKWTHNHPYGGSQLIDSNVTQNGAQFDVQRAAGLGNMAREQDVSYGTLTVNCYGPTANVQAKYPTQYIHQAQGQGSEASMFRTDNLVPGKTRQIQSSRAYSTDTTEQRDSSRSSFSALFFDNLDNADGSPKRNTGTSQSRQAIPAYGWNTMPCSPTTEYPPTQSHNGVTHVDLQHRERVLAWANAIYIDLLSFKQKREQGHSQSHMPAPMPVSGQRVHNVAPQNVQHLRINKNDMLPLSTKRGQCDGLHDSDQTSTQEMVIQNPGKRRKIDDFGSQQCHIMNESDLVRHQKQASQSTHLAYRPDSPTHHTDIFPGNNTGQFVVESSQNRASILAGKRRRSEVTQHHEREVQNLVHVLPVPKLYYVPYNDMPSVQNTSAMAALEMVGRLCMQSYGRWIEGMMLSGKLAQAIGNPNAAQRWFKQILEVEPNHPESLTHLGVSLLSTGSREDAERCWIKVVRTHPSHFEALEQLVTHLCAEKRGREAASFVEFMQNSLRHSNPKNSTWQRAQSVDSSASDTSMLSFASSTTTNADTYKHDYNSDADSVNGTVTSPKPLQNAIYRIKSSENSRLVQLIHAKGNMLYALGLNTAAAAAFEEAVLIATGANFQAGIRGLINKVLRVLSTAIEDAAGMPGSGVLSESRDPILLSPDRAEQTAKLLFQGLGELPGMREVTSASARKHAMSITSNSLLSLAKIYQDSMSTGNDGQKIVASVRDILALYYMSLSLCPSPSTANNVGILLASVQEVSAPIAIQVATGQFPAAPGFSPGSGISLALAYYNYGLRIDPRHAHLYTNLGSLLKDMGQLSNAIRMYERAVSCDGKFDIALANLANAVKDQGRISDAIGFYRRAVMVSPNFAEAVCGLANALNSVCDWVGRGGIVKAGGSLDRWHVDGNGMLHDAKSSGTQSSGWMQRVVNTVESQLRDGEHWGRGVLSADYIDSILDVIRLLSSSWTRERCAIFRDMVEMWRSKSWQGTKIVRLVERVTKRLGWQWYHDRHTLRKILPQSYYKRPMLPLGLSVPSAPTVLPFHTFTCPLTADQVRMISQRNGLRISCSTLRSSWLPQYVFPPPPPPSPVLHVGYVSSDFSNHPLAHLMQSVFGFHNSNRVKAFCYATSVSDGSEHRRKIEAEAPVFVNASDWSSERLVKKIVDDGIHILVNLNGFTRGARNEIFAARPAPIHMSFMGFAGTLGAEWSDYIYADTTAIPSTVLRPWKRSTSLEAMEKEECEDDAKYQWVYSENIVFAKHSFFCNDHRQSAPDSQTPQLSWDEEQIRRWQMRKLLFPQLDKRHIIFGNFNQLYKIEPTTFRTWLRILARVPNAILWLLRFPELGEANLKRTARLWAGEEVASRIVFTNVAPKNEHISRARVCDLFLDTPECNAHTTAADVLWSGTPLLTLPRYEHKMCSRIAASILRSAVPQDEEGRKAANSLIAGSEDTYENRAVELAEGLNYDDSGRGKGELADFRKMLVEGRWKNPLFDTKRWVEDLEEAYEVVWEKWVKGEEGNIWLGEK